MSDVADGTFVDADIFDPITFYAGDVKWTARRFPASGWLACDGSAVSRSTYAKLFAAIVPDLGVVTVTLASPGVFTLVSHKLVIGDSVFLTTTGALPTGLAPNTLYYVVSTPTTDTFTVSATRGGSAINTSGSQSGAHSVWWCAHGLGNGSTTFNVPDAPGRTLVAAAGASGHADVMAVGQNDGVALVYRRPKHRHTPHSHGGVWTNGAAPLGSSGSQSVNASGTTASADGGTGVSTDSLDAPANLVLNLHIKT